MGRIDCLNKLVDRVEKDRELAEKFKQNPLEELKRIAEKSHDILSSDLYRLVVVILGIVPIVVVADAICLSIRNGRNISEFLISVASGCLGARTGLLAPSHRL